MALIDSPLPASPEVWGAAAGTAPIARVPPRFGQALRPMPGETCCGDQIGGWFHHGQLTLALADGLGHGEAAHRAAAAALATLDEALGGAPGPGTDLPALFARCDQALTDTRGAALALIRLMPGRGLLLHAGVGNIRALVARRTGIRRLGCARGIVGAGYRNLRAEPLPLEPGDWVALYSDGLPENAEIGAMLAEAPASDGLAADILARWAIPDDDASLLIYRHD